MKVTPTRLLRKRGQNTAEYLIMLVLVAVGSIGLFSAFGGTLKKQLNSAVKSLSGVASEESFEDVTTHATNALNVGNGMDQKNAATARFGGAAGTGSTTTNTP